MFDNLGPHSVEISWFSCHSDFTWNQSLWFQKCKICHFNYFRGSEFWHFLLACFYQITRNGENRVFRTSRSSLKLISCKIWVTGKSWNFHTVLLTPVYRIAKKSKILPYKHRIRHDILENDEKSTKQLKILRKNHKKFTFSRISWLCWHLIRVRLTRALSLRMLFCVRFVS